MKRLFANIALLLAVSAVCIALAEAGLRVLTPFPIHGEKANKIYDRDFGYRLNLSHPTIDEHGFRNRDGKVKIVAAIGDSHTYGSGVEYEEAWPEVFEEITGVPAYNFGVGSYATYTYYAVGMYAADQGYKYVILALNIHNDFTIKGTSCDIDYDSSPFWQEAKARLDLHLPDCALEDTWRTADAPVFVRRLRNRLDSAILSAWDYLVVEPVMDWWHTVRFASGKTEKKAKEKEKSARPAEPENSEPAAEPRGGKRPASWYFNKRGVKILESAFHSTDMSHPVSRYVADDFEKMLLDLHRALGEKGGALGVLFIPSKLQLAYGYTDDRDIFEQIPWMEKMARNQAALETRLTGFMDANEISWRSAEPEFIDKIREAEESGGRVFTPSGNHPLPVGFRMYAVAAAKLFRQMRGTGKEGTGP